MKPDIERSKLFVHERLGKSPTIDAARVAKCIEFTRFPVPAGRDSDPGYPRKANALYWEFEEVGINRQLGYSSPADLIGKYPNFFWNSVSMYLKEGLKFLNSTHSDCQWIANLHNHLLCAEHGAG
jgi:hypothetical protein